MGANGADMPNFKVGPNGAELMPFLAWRGIECDSCNHHVEPGTAAFGNREINFDLCNDCFRESQKTVDSMKSGEDASEIDGAARCWACVCNFCRRCHDTGRVHCGGCKRRYEDVEVEYIHWLAGGLQTC